MESIRILKLAVKYFVVKNANVSGLFKAIPAKRTVQRGKRTVRVSVTLRYVSHSLDLDPVASATTVVEAIFSLVESDELIAIAIFGIFSDWVSFRRRNDAGDAIFG
jgi:hypothetical protein